MQCLVGVDDHAREIHARAERWALDEMPLSGELVGQIIEWLYRENRFCGGNIPLNAFPEAPWDESGSFCE